uniref:FkbM family methyltransferase n=1 Tax=Cyanothece sp. BG0011 TaxID=2082950 RepID=UPI0013005719
ELSRLQAYEFIQENLKGSSIKQILCVPYYSSDILLAIAVKDLYNVPLATYIMDDQNIVVNNIPDDLMREFLTKCSLRFATHPELRDAYENKYGLKFWLLPAVAPNHYVNTAITFPKADKLQAKTGALFGSIWSQSWFEMLCSTIKGANIKLNWFGNTSYWWLQQSSEELRQTTGITPFGVLSEPELAEKLKDYPYIVVPTGTLDERDDCQNLSQLSLPGRIIFALVSSNTPIIIIGSEKTGASHFVKRFGIGLTCDYDARAFKQAVDHITQPDVQKEMRHNAAKVAENFSDKGIKDWLWQSLQNEQPIDLRFENLLPRAENDIVHYLEAPVPGDIYKDYVPVYHVMRRLYNKGYRPDFMVDVGSSHGIWSHTTSKFFDEARFILIDPLMSKYEQGARDLYIKQIPNAELLEVAVSNQSGTTTFQVSPDLYGSSLLNPADYRTYDTVTVEVLTLDQIAQTYQLTGRGMLKLDVQCAEHIVLEGAKQFLEQVDAIVVELSLVRYDAEALVLREMLNLLDELGFRYYDETGDWRSPIDGTLLQKEIVFLRHNLLVFQTSDH